MEIRNIGRVTVCFPLVEITFEQSWIMKYTVFTILKTVFERSFLLKLTNRKERKIPKKMYRISRKEKRIRK